MLSFAMSSLSSRMIVFFRDHTGGGGGGGGGGRDSPPPFLLLFLGWQAGASSSSSLFASSTIWVSGLWNRILDSSAVETAEAATNFLPLVVEEEEEAVKRAQSSQCRTSEGFSIVGGKSTFVTSSTYADLPADQMETFLKYVMAKEINSRAPGLNRVHIGTNESLMHTLNTKIRPRISAAAFFRAMLFDDSIFRRTASTFAKDVFSSCGPLDAFVETSVWSRSMTR